MRALCFLPVLDGTFSVQTRNLSLYIFHFVLNKSWMVAVNEPKACLNKKQSLSQLTRFGFLNIPFVWSLNTHEDSQNSHIEILKAFHSDFPHLFRMFYFFFHPSLFKGLKILEAWRALLLRGKRHSPILDLIPLAAAQTATDRHIISWGVLALQPTSKHRTEPLLCIAAFRINIPMENTVGGRRYSCVYSSLFSQRYRRGERNTGFLGNCTADASSILSPFFSPPLASHPPL